MRSGTHILIDLILNNLPSYRIRPLYIDLDQYLWAGMDIQALRQLKGAVIKTHYPQVNPPNFEAAIDALDLNSIVISPQRKYDDIAWSLQKFWKDENVFSNKDAQAFREYWDKYTPVIVPFEDMLQPKKATEMLVNLGALTNCQPKKKIIFPPAKETPLLWVYLCKLLTRLLGKNSPVINTTISFKVSG